MEILLLASTMLSVSGNDQTAFQLPKLDLSWIITTVIAIAALVSPIFVALINNRYNVRLKNLEFTHVETLKQMELSEKLSEKQFEIYYSDKKTAFSEFLLAAGSYTIDESNLQCYAKLQSTAKVALLFCSPHAQSILSDFLFSVDAITEGSFVGQPSQEFYNKLLAQLATDLSKELESTKPVTNSK